MREHPDLWQGYFGYWQTRFIQQNLPLIGHAAWSGYLKQSRGMVVCQVLEKVSAAIDWTVETVPFELTYVPEAQVNFSVQELDLKQETVAALLEAIATYDPERAIALLVLGNSTVDISLLQPVKLSPVDCYEQVQRRWSEFQTGTLPR